MNTYVQNNSPTEVLSRVQKYVSGVNYPAEKDKIITTAEREGADIIVIDLLQTLPLQRFHTPKEVERALLS
jgi:hypothetical protein